MAAWLARPGVEPSLEPNRVTTPHSRGPDTSGRRALRTASQCEPVPRGARARRRTVRAGPGAGSGAHQEALVSSRNHVAIRARLQRDAIRQLGCLPCNRSPPPQHGKQVTHLGFHGRGQTEANANLLLFQHTAFRGRRHYFRGHNFT